MVQIRARTDSKGNTRRKAIIRRYKDKAVVHQEYRTFPRQALAADWAKLDGVAVAQVCVVAIGRLIQRYIGEFESTARLVQHMRERRAQGTGPTTAGNDLTWLGVVLRTARCLPTIASGTAKGCGTTSSGILVERGRWRGIFLPHISRQAFTQSATAAGSRA